MTLLIVFNDGTERRIENVRTAGLESVDCFMFTEGNDRGRAFVPKENIRYFGPEELWVEPHKTPGAIIKELEGHIFEDPKDIIESTWNSAFRRAIRIIKEKTNE